MGRHEGNHENGRMYGQILDDPPTVIIPIKDRVRTVVRTFGELMLTAGMVVLLFVFYEVYVTDWISAGKQREATAALDDQWRQSDTVQGGDRTVHYDLKEGEGFAKLYIPAFGADYEFTLLEGTADKDLEIGPGHYKGTALPGMPGNFAVAGHRVGKGAPFNDLDLLQSCDAIVIETKTDWFVYRMLPTAAEKANWAATKGTQPTCKNVAPLGGVYQDVVGQEIVTPNQGAVIAPVPHRQDAPPQADQVALLTLTTCHPRFSDRQRLIIHAVLVDQMPKDPAHPDARPAALSETG